MTTLPPGSGLGADPAAPGSEEVLALLEEVARHDGVAAVGEAGLLRLRHGTPATHLWRRRGGALVGYAQLDETGTAELCVRPAHRRQGVGRELLRELLDRWRARATDVAGWHPAVWAHGHRPAARALAGAEGLRLTRELLQLARPLPAGDSIDPGPLPPDVRVRTFVPGRDDGAWVELNSLAFADHPEQGSVDVAGLRQRQAEDWFDPDLLWLAYRDGSPEDLLASMWVKAVPGSGEGEIYALGVHPRAQGRGLGRWLTGHALAGMAERGLRRATLYVEAGNVAAVRTYTGTGFVRHAEDAQYSPVAGPA